MTQHRLKRRPENPPTIEASYADSSSDEASSSFADAEELDVGASRPFILYTAFSLVGTSCGWFALDAIYNLMANEPEVQQGGKMYGFLSIVNGLGGLGGALLYFIYIVASPCRLSMRAEQLVVACIASSTILVLTILMFFWNVGAPRFPVVCAMAVISNIVANCTYFFIFPLLTAYYHGWLVAPVRAGTDFTALISALVAEAQNPTGSENRFPSWFLFFRLR